MNMLFVLFPSLYLVSESLALVLPFKSKHSSMTGLLAKRTLAVSQSLINLGNRYTIQLNLGTPPQGVEVMLDTYSSDCFLLDPNVPICKSRSCEMSIFDSSKSSTFVKTDMKFDIVYDDESTVSGFFGSDELRIGKAQLKGFKFAVAQNSTTEIPVCGIGLGINEYPFVSGQLRTTYDNLPMLLKKQGYIRHIGYSVWLNSWDETQGLINFGSIDKRLMASGIYRFPFVESMYENYRSSTIKLDAINFISRDLNRHRMAETSIPVVFDHGTAISRLPLAILESLYIALGVNFDTFTIPCKKLNWGGGISLVFSGVEFVFKFRDIAAPIDETLQDCIPGFKPDDIPRIGANLLRGLYVVYDFENLELGIALANTRRDIEDFDPVEIEIKRTIPGTKVPSYSNTKLLFQYLKHPINLEGPYTTNKIRYVSPDSSLTTLSHNTKIFTPDARIVLGDAYGIGIVPPYIYVAKPNGDDDTYTQLERKRSPSVGTNIP